MEGNGPIDRRNSARRDRSINRGLVVEGRAMGPQPSSPSSAPPPWGWRTRAALVGAALGLLGALGLARALEPDARGWGTHTRLGLRPCPFRTATSRPCPTCGMTTAFAWFARGRWERSWRANPAGLLIAAAAMPLAAWTAAGALRGRPWFFKTFSGPFLGLLAVATAVSLVVWLVRMALADVV